MRGVGSGALIVLSFGSYIGLLPLLLRSWYCGLIGAFFCVFEFGGLNGRNSPFDFPCEVAGLFAFGGVNGRYPSFDRLGDVVAELPGLFELGLKGRNPSFDLPDDIPVEPPALLAFGGLNGRNPSLVLPFCGVLAMDAGDTRLAGIAGPRACLGDIAGG